MSSDSLYDSFARMMARPDGGPGRAPRFRPPLSVLGQVAAADPYQGTMSFDAGGGLVIPEVGYIQQYTANELPRAGDPVIMTLVAGAAPFIAGRFRLPGQLGGSLS